MTDVTREASQAAAYLDSLIVILKDGQHDRNAGTLTITVNDHVPERLRQISSLLMVPVLHEKLHAAIDEVR